MAAIANIAEVMMPLNSVLSLRRYPFTRIPFSISHKMLAPLARYFAAAGSDLWVQHWWQDSCPDSSPDTHENEVLIILS